MKLASIWVCIVLLALPVLAGDLRADDEQGKTGKGESAKSTDEGTPQTHCPVTGKEMSDKVYVDYNDKRIYFCSPDCIEEFKKNPKGFIRKMEKTGVVFEKAPERELEKKHELTPGEDGPHDHRHH